MSEEATVPLSEDVREAIAFVGETLGPFYLQDPVKGDAGPAFAAMAAIDVAQAAVEWPFVDEAEARCDLDLEDHVGLMLVLMAWIARNQPQDLGEFLRLHLLTWSSHFLDQLIEAAGQPFYEGLARLTKASLEGIQAELGLDVVYPRFYR